MGPHQFTSKPSRLYRVSFLFRPSKFGNQSSKPELVLLPFFPPPPSRFLHRLILIMQLEFCEALLMLKMNAACSLVFFAAAPSPSLPSANDSSWRCIESRLHTESSSHGCTNSTKCLRATFYSNFNYFRKTADVAMWPNIFSLQSPVIYWNRRQKCIWIYLQITTALCCNTGQNYDEKKSIHIKNRAWSPSLLLPSVTFFYIVIVYNSMVNTYYQSPKPELVLLPSPSSLPSVTFFTLLL